MRVQVTKTTDDLERDLRGIPVEARQRFTRTVRRNTEQGNRLAANFARVSAGKHGKHYHKAFSGEMVTPLIGEYGPDASMPQGGMSFEFGSRNQPPHLDLAKSADIQGPQFAKDVNDDLDGLFW
jgi:hypothetical protein